MTDWTETELSALRRAYADRGIETFQCYATADLGSIAYESAVAAALDQAGNALALGSIDAAARAASDLGYSTTVIADAFATRDLEFQGTVVPAAQVHAAMMSGLAFGYATVTDARDWIGNPPAA